MDKLKVSTQVQHNAVTFPENYKKETEPTVVFETEPLKLKREIGFFSGLSFVVGVIIGSGIFITPQGVLRNTGSVGLCIAVWISGAILSMLETVGYRRVLQGVLTCPRAPQGDIGTVFNNMEQYVISPVLVDHVSQHPLKTGALTFTELTSVVRKSGGEYAILLRTLGPIPAFAFVWANEIARNPAGRAVQILTFSEYLATFMDMCGSPPLPKRLIAICVLVLLTFINLYSISLTARIQIFFTAAKLLALVVIIVGGMIKISQGTVSDLPSGFEGTITAPSNLALAFYSVMFAYGGWNNVNFLIEEVKNPRRNGPLSSVVGVVIVGVVYILANVSYLAVMTKQELLQSSAVAQTWGERVLGSAAGIIPVAVMMSVFGSANGGISTATRIQFVAARDGNWWGFLSYVNVKRYTPMPVILFHVILSAAMVLQGTITSLITFLSFSSWLFYGLCAFCCIVLRFKVKDDPKVIKIPLVIHIIFMLWCAFLVIAPIAQNPRIELLYAMVFIAGGVLLYYPMVYFDLKPKCIERLEMYLQLLLEVAPSTYDADDY